MNDRYTRKAEVFKALSDPKRLKIVDILSCGEMCACDILDKFMITQPTLSHHMRTLCECGLVSCRKEGKWMYYSIDTKAADDLKDFLRDITEEKENCICKTNIVTEL
ncbi:MAG: metalloregulator ArsR/SmtB family transcription factor [Candidatus Methanoplasma sp.]|nr:metalloregulator ArsR/SmtB family transcription factor [Candidatus Methanoplasma sp.]